MKKLSDLVIVSDIDGTLLHAPHPIPPRNLTALHRFTKRGGRFALASGRSLVSLRQYLDQLPVNAPCLVFNGGGVYDYATHQLHYACYLPDTAIAYAKALTEAFPQVGYVFLDRYEMHAPHNAAQANEYLQVEHLLIFERSWETLDSRYFKLLMGMPTEQIEAVQTFALAQGWEDVSFVRTGPHYLEMMPKGSNKGTGLRQLIAHTGIPPENIVAIGDYYNDLEMLQSAHFPVTVAGAPDEIKQLCKLVVGPCADGALADLVEYLEEHYE